MQVNFLDLKAQYLTIKDEIHEAIDQVIDKTAFAGGPFVEAFEKDFAAYCQTEHALGVGNGTEALWLALLCGTDMRIYRKGDYRAQYLYRHSRGHQLLRGRACFGGCRSRHLHHGPGEN